MSRSDRTAAAVATSGLLAVATLALAGPTAAQGEDIAYVPFNFEVFQSGELLIVAELSTGCDTPLTADQITFEFGGAPTADIVATVDGSQSEFLITVPQDLATVAGSLNVAQVSVTCDVMGVPETRSTPLGWAQINVTKTVVGDGPATGFRAVIECAPTVGSGTTFDIEFDAGETFAVFAVTNGSCAIEETETLGATSSNVSPGEVEIQESRLYPVEITNTFPEASSTTTTTSPGGEPVTPRFTG